MLLREKCEIGKKISNTIYGSLLCCQLKSTEEIVAVKICDYESCVARVDRKTNHRVNENVFSELEALTLLQDNDHIVKLIDYFEDVDIINKQEVRLIVLIFEFCDYDLFRVVQSKFDSFTLNQVRQYMKDILLGIYSIHALNLVHRDISLENVLVKNNKVKICDFGLCLLIDSNNKDLYEKIGKPNYIAPELLSGTVNIQYINKIDVYACGIMLFILLNGFPPFDISNELIDGTGNFKLFVENNCNIEIILKKYSLSIPDVCIPILNGLLNIDPIKRWTIEEAMNDPFFVIEDEY